MLWGMTLQPGYEYTEVVNDEVRLSMASLECRPTKGGSLEMSSYVVLKTTRGEFLLCTLEKGPTPQQHLDLVLQPRERVTFSVEGSGVVHLMGYTSECPEDQQEDEDPPITGPPPEEPSYMDEKDVDNGQQQHQQEQEEPLQEDHNITIKQEPESVVIPILEEALDDLDQNEQAPATGMHQPAMQGNVGQSYPPADNYTDYQSMDQGWVGQPQTSSKVPNPSARVDPAPIYAPNQGHGAMPGNVQQSPGYPQMRGMAAASTPSTSYAQQAAERLQGAAPPTDMIFAPNPGANVVMVPQKARGPRCKVQRLDHDRPGRRQNTKMTRDASVVRQTRQKRGTSGRVYRCDQCNKEFDDRSMYLVHQTRHTGKNCFHCEFCMKPFANRSELEIHERYHTGVKPFQCKYCQKRFQTNGDCQKHERCHTGEKPFACSICGKGYADVSNLRKHERTHSQSK